MQQRCNYLQPSTVRFVGETLSIHKITTTVGNTLFRTTTLYRVQGAEGQAELWTSPAPELNLLYII